jgi:hypothetical protein
MKFFRNLPGNLRALFGFLRVLTVLMAAFWFMMLTFNHWIQRRFVDEPKLIVSIGTVSVKTSPDPAALHFDHAKPGSLVMTGDVRRGLQADLLSDDPALVSAVRWTILPSMAASLAFAWLLFGSLRTVCGNIERGEVFSPNNFRLVRGIGWFLVGYSVVAGGLDFWAAHTMGAYLNQHVTLTGFLSPAKSGPIHFGLTNPFPIFSGLIAGCLVLMVSEAFRQGFALKQENELTV